MTEHIIKADILKLGNKASASMDRLMSTLDGFVERAECAARGTWFYTALPVELA